MKYVKSENRTRLTYEHLKAIPLVGCSNIKPNLDDILKNKRQFHDLTKLVFVLILLFILVIIVYKT